MLEDAPTAEDQVLEANGIKVYVDGSSISLLQGSQIDYVDTLMGAGFTVNNPNAVAACGCGSSFRTADDGGAAGRLLALTVGTGRVWRQRPASRSRRADRRLHVFPLRLDSSSIPSRHTEGPRGAPSLPAAHRPLPGHRRFRCTSSRSATGR